MQKHDMQYMSKAAATPAGATAAQAAQPAGAQNAEQKAGKGAPPQRPPRLPEPPVRTLFDSPFLTTIQTALKEFQAVWYAPIPLKEKIDKLDNFAFSADSQKKLEAAFGRGQPLHVNKKLVAGGTDLDVLFEPLSYTDAASGQTISWEALHSVTHFNRSYTHASGSGSWPRLSFENGSGGQLALNGSSYRSELTPDKSSFWSGHSNVTIPEIVYSQRGEQQLRIADVKIASSLARHAKLLDMRSDMTLAEINWNRDRVGPVRYALAVKNLDGQALSEMQRDPALSQMPPAGPARQAWLATNHKSLLKFLTPSSSFELQDFSLTFHEVKATLTGRAGFVGARQADFAQPATLWNKIVAHFDLRVPVALVEQVAHALFGKGKDAAGQKKAEASATAMVEGLKKNLLEKKFIRIENGVIISSFDFKLGKLAINGKPLAVPAPGSAVKPAPKAAPKTAPKSAPEPLPAAASGK